MNRMVIRGHEKFEDALKHAVTVTAGDGCKIFVRKGMDGGWWITRRTVVPGANAGGVMRAW